MWLSFPREVCFPNRILVRDYREFHALVKSMVPYSDIYTTLYSFQSVNGKRPYYNTAIIDKALFDFDDENAYEVTLRLHQFFEEKKIAHCINFSGRGFHVIPLIKYSPVLNSGEKKSLQVYEWQKTLNDRLELNQDKTHVSHYGLYSKEVRLPNTINQSQKLYCVNLTHHEFHNFSKSIAKRPKKHPIQIIGEKLVDISNIPIRKEPESITPVPVNINNKFRILEFKHPACFKKMLKKAGNRERFIILTFLKDKMLFTQPEAIEWCRKYLPKEKFLHMLQESQVEYVYQNNIIAVNRNRVQSEGYCDFECVECHFE